MKPSDFLSIDDFANLTGEEQADYVQAFLEAFHDLPDDAGRRDKARLRQALLRSRRAVAVARRV
jgi:hypothetical protein